MVSSNGADTLREWIARHRRVFVLTGAGVSTASGIPDYRDVDGRWKRPAPVTYQAFVGDGAARARYWARSFVGWPRVAGAAPNAAHRALADHEPGGGIALVLTQNVDGLHQKAGSRAVVDLHGRLDAVVCLRCGARAARDGLQARIAAANPAWRDVRALPAPDGDADLAAMDVATFRVPDCSACGGLLKPDVVFFGENVPRARVDAARDALARSDAMLVVGSSLMVYSGYRFARMAHEAGIPLAILTRGVTRADALADLKVDADCGPALARALA
jgi:NAD-dependent SIR2 family protein deacetylase